MSGIYYNVILNAIAACNLVLLLSFTGVRNRRNDIDVKLFNNIIFTVFLTIAADIAMLFLDGKTVAGSNTFMYIATILYLSLSTLPSLFWMIYVAKHFNVNIKFRKIIVAGAIAVEVIHFAFLIASIWTGWIFIIDPATNLYHRGPAIYFNAGVSYLFVIVAMAIIFINRRKTETKRFVAMLMFMVPPLVCSFIQMAVYGITLIGFGFSFALLLQYLYVQNDLLFTDELTGLYNRRKLQNYLTSVCHKPDSNKYLVGVMMDINKFKTINDTYGHSMGDRALIDAAHILQRSVTSDAFLARYAGDEFVIVAEKNTKEEADNIVSAIKYNCERFNVDPCNKYKITFGIGLYVTEREKEVDVDFFLDRIDNEMYNDKIKQREEGGI